MSESETVSAQISCWTLWRFLGEAFDQRLMDLREISANHKLWGAHVLSKWWGAKPPFPAGFPSSPRFKSFFKRLSSLPWRSSWWFRLTQRRSLKLSGAHVTEFQAWRLDGEMNSGSLRRMSVNDPREDRCLRESWMGSFLQELRRSRLHRTEWMSFQMFSSVLCLS